jgi:AraC family transcriptional regulator
VDAPAGGVRSQPWVHHIIALLDAAARQLREEDPDTQDTLLKAAHALKRHVELLPKQAGQVGGVRLLAWQVCRVRSYVDGHLGERIRVTNLSAVAQLSTAHFSRAFKRTFGESPHAFVIRRRLECAAHYLLHTEASVSDIALRCGFADQAHLCRAFRQATGLSPAIWRRTRRMHHELWIVTAPSREQVPKSSELPSQDFRTS